MRSLFLILLPGLLVQEAGLRELIQRLEDDRVESREKAQKDLASLGEAALPALRDVVESPRSSGELKLRAAAAIRDIELGLKAAKVYREYPRLTLKASDTMLREVLDEVARQAGVAIDASAVDGAAKVTLDAGDATLMEVLDRICRGQADRTWETRDDGSVRMLRDRHVDYPAAYSGPFRVRVQAMNAERNNDFKARTVSVTLTLQADWDKRLKPSKVVDLEVTKAVDDLGTALEAAPLDANTFFRGPGVQLRVGVGVNLLDGSENARSFTVKGLPPAAGAVTFEGNARYTFPLDQREIKIEKPGNSETKDLGDTTVRLTRNGTPEIWSLSFHKNPTSTTPGWARMISQRFDPDSFVVVDQDGQEFNGTLRTLNRGRQFQESAAEVGVWYQGVVQRNTAKAIKEVKFKFVDQTLIKSMPFKFTALPLP